MYNYKLYLFYCVFVSEVSLLAVYNHYMPRGSLPRCDECRRAIRGRRIVTCSCCLKKFHKKCFTRDTTNHDNNFYQRYRLRICLNCSSSINIQHTPASTLNEKFNLPTSEPTDDDDPGDIYFHENSNDRYYDVEDVETLTSQPNQNDNFFTICINIRGLNVIKNFIGLVALIESLPKKPHLIAVNETWTKEEEAGPFNNIDGYKFIANCRKDHECGGVAFYIQQNITFSIREDLTVMDEKIFESLFVDLTINHKPITLGTIYRSPDELVASNNSFLHHLKNTLNIINRKNSPCFIMGDMNFDLLDLDSPAEDLFKDEMFSFSYYPIINHPTRITDTSATSIDHIWTNIVDRPITSGIITDRIADHLPIFQMSNLGKIHKEEHKKSSLSANDLNKLNSILSCINVSEAIAGCNIDVSFEIITKLIFQSIYAIKTSRKPERKRDKWYDKSLHKLKIKSDRLYKKCISDSTNINKRTYNEAKNKYYSEIHRKRDLFYKNLFDKYKKNMKATWQVINKLLGKNKSSTNITLQCKDETITEPIEVANKFNSYFSSIADNIRKNIPPEPKDFKDYLHNRGSTRSIYFYPTDPHEVGSDIRKAKLKDSSGIDGISSRVLKSLPANFIEALSLLFNKSMAQGFFPTKFKTAIVVPIYKKKGSRKNIEQYRPISLLSSLSKILEKLIYKRVSKFLEKSNFFPKTQFGFRKGLSTSHAISLLVNTITKAMNKKQKTLGLFLDFLKAFDLIDHKILLQKISKCGIRGVTKKWFESYLENRTQQVQVNGTLSSNICKVKHGTPQGSILGPLLFLIYISDLPNCLQYSSPLFYADDTNLLLSATLCDDLIEKGNEELRNINEWVNCNKLSLNTDKTHALIFRTPNTKIPENLPNLNLGNIPIDYAETTDFLGVTVAQNLSWKSHMTSIKKKLRKNLGACRKIKKQLGETAMISLYHTMMESHVRNGITSWCHGNTTIKNSIQRSCDKFLKMTFSISNPQALRHKMNVHQILSIDQILFLEIGMAMQKIHNKSFPTCFNDFFTQTSHAMSTRSNRSFNVDRPRIELTKQSLNYKGTLVWNKIPNTVKYIRCSNPPQLYPNNVFKSQLKNFLLSEGPVAITFYLNEILYSSGN